MGSAIGIRRIAQAGHELASHSYAHRLVYDLTYGATEAPLLRDARQAGCQTLDGLPMLVAQAERQFAWWTGRPVPAGVMRAAVDARARG